MLRAVCIFFIVSLVYSCKPVHNNVLIYRYQRDYQPCEPSIAINPLNTKEVVAGSVLDNVHFSEDGGRNWKTRRLRSSHGVYGDPVIFADWKNAFYYCHLGDPDKRGWASDRLLESIVVQRSDDGGKNWNDGSAVGTNPPKDQDKEWGVADPFSNWLYMTWTEFDKYNSDDPDCRSRILFSSSSNRGDSWTAPITLSAITGDCLDDDATTEGAVPAAGRDGRVFVAWSVNEKIYFNRSFDNGQSWMEREVAVAEQIGGWTLPIEGISRVNGMPVTCVDNSGGPFDGRIYIMWADQREGRTNTNIYLKKSDDDGQSWSKTILINKDDNKRQQFFPWMSVDPVSGFIYVVYYNREAHTGLQNDVSLAWSYDGGDTWDEKIISNRSFDTPPELIFFGDYNNVSAVNGSIRPIWTRYDEGVLSIWTALIQEKRKIKNKS